MNIFLWIMMIGICILILKSIITFIRGEKFQTKFRDKESKFSLEVFYTLLIVYTIVITGFALIYFILSFQNMILIEHGDTRKAGVISSLIHSFYFSGVTLLTIGYGDIVPVGVGRFIALIEALIGYILPTAFVLRLVNRQVLSDTDKERKNKF